MVFQKFKNGEFAVEDNERSGRPKVYKDAEFKRTFGSNAKTNCWEFFKRKEIRDIN